MPLTNENGEFTVLGRREIELLLCLHDVNDEIIVDFFHHYPGGIEARGFFILAEDGEDKKDTRVFTRSSMLSGDEIIRFILQTSKLLWLMDPPNEGECLFLSRVETFEYFLPALAPSTLECFLRRISIVNKKKHKFTANVRDSHRSRDTPLAHLEFSMSSVPKRVIAKMLSTHREFIRQINGSGGG